MSAAYDLNFHIHCDGPRPAGAMPTTVKTPFVVVTHKHPRARAHRPTYAVLVPMPGRTVLAARFTCGGAAVSVTPFNEVPAHINPCEECERITSGTPGSFFVYAYYDAQGRVLYVGQTHSITQRHKAHRRSSPWYADAVHRGTLSEHATRKAALAAEADAIAELRPLHNVRGVAA